jgi:hypothetical protein
VKPHFAKPLPEPTLQVQEDSEDDATGVAETQVVGDAASGSESDSDASDYASDASHTPNQRKVQKKKPEAAAEGVVKKTARKIKATAHANYRRLKIRGNGATGGKGKFGRRR